MKNRVISLLLVLCMLLTAVPAVAAEETAQTPKFTAYNLVLNESIAVNFKLSNYDGNNFGKVEFVMDDEVKQTITERPEKSGDVYVFRFTKLSPDLLAEDITVNFYLEGSTTPDATATRSVRDYAESILSNPYHDQDIKAVVMDMLLYGEAFQEYKAAQAGVDLHHTERITYALNNAYKGYATQKEPELKSIKSVGDQTGMSVQWLIFGLNLGEVVGVYYDFETDSLEGLSLKLTVDGKDFEVTEFEEVYSVPETEEEEAEFLCYRARFNKLNPVQMKEAIAAQFYRNGEPASALYTDSIEGYAARATDSSVQTVVTKMMQYGNATETWVEGSEDDDEGDEPAVIETTEIYVDSTAAVGEGDGTKANPLANIEEARDMIRAMKAADKYPATGGVTVYFREGTYMFSETAYFNAEDAGTAESPITYKAYDKDGTKEEVSFVGGMSFDIADFKPVTDPAVIARLADPEHTMMLDLEEQGLYDYGQLHVYGMAASYFTMAGIPIQTKAAPELFYGDQAMQLAKYPDGDNTWLKVVTVKQVGDVIQNWNHSTAHGDDYIPPENRPAIEDIKNSIFTVQDSVTERMQNWSQAEDIWVYGWWQVDYSDQSMPVKSLTVDESGTGVVETGIPSGKKITAGRRFYFYNLLEEITEPGEYYIDRENGILYAYLPGETGSLSYGSLDGPVIKLGGGCKYMTVEGINFSTGQTNGIEVDGAEQITLRDLDVSGFTQKGITLKDCRDVLVTGCHVHQTGSGGITMSYGMAREPYATAIKTLTSLNVVIEHCDIHDYSRISKTYSAGIGTAGIGTIVRNCRIYNGDHYAIALGGNDTLIENCEIFNVLRSAGDSGAIYNGFSKHEEGQVVRNCYFHDIGSGTGDDVSVVYMDDTKDGVTFESNLLVNIGGRGFFMNGGWNNKAQNNIMINVKTEGLLGDMGMGGTSRYDLDAGNYDSFWEIYNNPDVYTAHSQKYEHWDEKYDLLYDTANNGKFYNAPHYNVIQNNILIDVTNVVQVSANRGASAGGEWNAAKSREFNTVIDGTRYTLEQAGFVDARNGDFNLAEDSALREVLGEKAPNFSLMGMNYQVDAPAGYGGDGYPAVEAPKYEGEDYAKVSGPLFTEDFSDDSGLTNWTVGSAVSSGIVDGAMQYVVGNSNVNTTVRFKEYAGKVQYELDFMVDFGDCTSIDSGIIIVKGMNAAGTEKSLFNLQAKPNANFGAYDGGGGTRNSVKVEENVLYKVRVICDPETDTYDFYVNDQPVIIGGKMRSDAGDVVSFNGICVDQKSNATAGSEVTFTYDNIRVTAVGYELFREDFTSPYALENWNKSGGTTELVDGKLVVTAEPTGQINHVAPISEYRGIVTFETDFAVDFKGNTGVGTDGKPLMDAGTILIKGKDTAGKEQSLLNLKVRANTLTFGAYDGNGSYVGQDHETEVKFEENKTYRIKVVCDPYTDTYDMYVDNVLVMEGYLRYDAASFTGICINQNRKGGDTAPVFTYDNMLAYTGDGGIIEAPEKDDNVTGGDSASLLYEEYFSDPSAVNNWTVPAGDEIEINGAGQLQITKKVTGSSVNSVVTFKDAVAVEGKVTYEIDFAVDLNGCWDTDPNIFVVKGNGGSASLLNLKVYIDQETGKITFGAYDGTTEHPSDVECIEGKTHRITVICDTASDTYDYYVDGVEVFKGAPLRSNATNFTGLQLTIHKNNACEHEGRAVVCLDNIRAYAGAKNPSSGLYMEDFSDPDSVNDWNSSVPAGDSIVINDNGQLQITKSSTTSINPNVYFNDGATQEGKVTYEVDFKVELNGCYLVDPNIFVVRGNDSSASLLNPKVYIDADTGKMVFGAYDGTNGGAEHKSTVECVEGKTYHVTIICDTASDTYDFYVDGQEVFKGAPLRSNATNFSGLQLTIHKSKCADTTHAPVIYFDNFAVWAGDIYTGESGGEEEEPDEPVTPEDPDVPEAPKGEYVIGEVYYSNDFATEAGGALALTSGTKSFTLSPAQTGKVAIQYQTRLATSDSAFKGKAFFRGNASKTFANVGFSGGKVDLSGNTIAGVTYENNTWYTVMLVIDFEAQTYNVYLDGVRIQEAKSFQNAESDLLTLYFTAESGTGTAYFENLIVGSAVVNDEPDTPDEPEVEIKEVLMSDDFSTNTGSWSGGTVKDGVLEVTQAVGGSDVYVTYSNADFTAEIAKANTAKKKLLVEFDMMLSYGSDASTMKAGLMLKNTAESDGTAVEFAGMNGKVQVQWGTDIADAMENGKTHNIKIVTDPVTDPEATKVDFYIDGVPVKTGASYTGGRTAWNKIMFMVKLNDSETSAATLTVDNFKVSLYDGSAILPDVEFPEATVGKKALVLGDSLTSAGQWQTKLTTELGMTVETHALGGLSMSAIIDGGTVGSNTLPALTVEQVADKDLIVFYGGYNNRHQTAEAFADTMTASINKIKALLATAENTECRIMIVTPHFVGKSQWLYGSSVPLDGDDVPPADSPSATVSLETLVNAMVAEAQEINIPVYDLFHNSGIGPDTWNTYSNQVADENGYKPGATVPTDPTDFSHYADQVHLNSTGYALIGTQIAEFVLENWDHEYTEPEQPDEPEVPTFAESVTLGEELETNYDGTTIEKTSGTQVITLTTPATGKVAIQYKTNVVTTAAGFQGKAYFKQSATEKTFANVTFKGGVISTNGNTEGMTATYADNTWYDVAIVMDIDAKTYDVYLDGKLIRDNRGWENSATATALGTLHFQADTSTAGSAGTASFKDITVHQVVENVTPEEPVGTVVYSNTFDDQEGEMLTLTSTASAAAQEMYKLSAPATGKITIEYKIKVETESTSFNAKAFFKPSTTGNPTFINIGLKGGNVNLPGDYYLTGEWNTVKLEVDLSAKSYNVILNGTSLTPDGKTWTADANDLDHFYLCAEAGQVGTAYFDDIVITAFPE